MLLPYAITSAKKTRLYAFKSATQSRKNKFAIVYKKARICPRSTLFFYLALPLPLPLPAVVFPFFLAAESASGLRFAAIIVVAPKNDSRRPCVDLMNETIHEQVKDRLYSWPRLHGACSEKWLKAALCRPNERKHSWASERLLLLMNQSSWCMFRKMTEDGLI